MVSLPLYVLASMVREVSTAGSRVMISVDKLTPVRVTAAVCAPVARRRHRTRAVKSTIRGFECRCEALATSCEVDVLFLLLSGGDTTNLCLMWDET